MKSQQKTLSDQYLSVPHFFQKITTQKESYELADPRATRALVSLMNMHAVIGGAACHFGGPAAFAEIMSALHGLMFKTAKLEAKPWHQLFNFVNDAGHCENGIYALRANYEFGGLKFSDLEGFRSIESVLTGHGESHLYPEGVLMSNGPLGSAFPQSQGLAMADSLLQNNRVTVCAISDGACMEGEAREAMAAIPGFASKGKLNPYLLLISDNNTKLGGRIDKDSYSLAGTFQSLKSLGWELVIVENGHDLKLVMETLEKALDLVRSNPKIPIAIQFKTKKGFGSQKAIDSSSGGHGFPLKKAAELKEFLKEIYSGDSIPSQFADWASRLESIESQKKSTPSRSCPEWSSTSEKIQVGVASAMIAAKKMGLPIVSICSDLAGSTGTAAFQKEFPESSLDVGIAESNMVSVAAGFSKSGFIPFVDTFAQFGVTKGALPLTMAQLSESPIIGIFSHTGFQDAADGASHQALSYLAMLSSIPNVRTFCLSSSSEAHDLILQACQEFSAKRAQGGIPPSYIFFLGRENFPKFYSESQKNNLWKAQIYKAPREKPTSVVFAQGSMLPEALYAQKLLKEKGISVSVVNSPCSNHLDRDVILSEIKNAQGNVIVMEDHQKIGGLSHVLSAFCAENNAQVNLKIFAVDNEFGRSAYTSFDLYKRHQITAEDVVNYCVTDMKLS